MVCRLFLVTNLFWRDGLRLKSHLFEEAFPAYCVTVGIILCLICLKFCSSIRSFIGFLFTTTPTNTDEFQSVWCRIFLQINNIISKFGQFRFSGNCPILNDDLICIMINTDDFLYILTGMAQAHTWEQLQQLYRIYKLVSDNAHGNIKGFTGSLTYSCLMQVLNALNITGQGRRIFDCGAADGKV